MFLAGFSFGVPYNGVLFWQDREIYWACGTLLICCSLFFIFKLALIIRNDPLLENGCGAGTREDEDDQVLI